MDGNKVFEYKEYKASKSEMDRRLKAFMRLILFLYISACICSIDLVIKRPAAAAPVLIISAVALALLWLFFRNVFKKEAEKKVYLSQNEMLRNFGKSKEKYLIKDITDIRIKRTVNKSIRELRIKTTGANNVFINGLEDMEQFAEYLINIAPDASVNEMKEPIDYGHPLYYVVFGAVTGAALALLLRISAFAGEHIVKYIQVFSGGFLAAAGAFWILYKPLQNRYGSRKTLADDIMGLIFLFIGFGIFIISKVFW